MFERFKRKGKRKPAPRTWRDTDLFRRMTDAELDEMSPFVRPIELSPGNTLVREGEPATDVFLVASGTLDVVTRDDEGDREIVIGEVCHGEVVGEVAVFDELPRSATVRARTDCLVYSVAFHDLRPAHDLVARSTMDPRPKSIRRAYHKLLENLAASLADRFRERNAELRDAAKHRDAVGSFLVNILLLVCFYTFLLSGLERLENAPANTSYISIPIQIVFALGSWRFIRGTGYPLEGFGLSTKHFFGSIAESVLFTAPVLALLTALKWLMLLVRGNPNGVPLIEHIDVLARMTDVALFPLVTIYALSSIVQELIVRCALQSSLQMFLLEPGRRTKAIVISALIFAMTHLHMSFLFAAAAFLPGIFWGWLYARRPNLAGVAFSHIAVGCYVFFIMGVRI